MEIHRRPATHAKTGNGLRQQQGKDKNGIYPAGAFEEINFEIVAFAGGALMRVADDKTRKNKKDQHCLGPKTEGKSPDRRLEIQVVAGDVVEQNIKGRKTTKCFQTPKARPLHDRLTCADGLLFDDCWYGVQHNSEAWVRGFPAVGFTRLRDAGDYTSLLTQRWPHVRNVIVNSRRQKNL